MKELKLEVGKTYRSREGEEVRIVDKINPYGYHYQGSNGKWYTESGRFDVYVAKSPSDLIEEVTATRHTFAIPEGVKEITLDYFGNRIVVEMVPEKGPKPGDVMVNTHRSVYIFKDCADNGFHEHYAWLDSDGRVYYGNVVFPGRPATTEEAQPLFDALKKAGKKWNPETMKVEEIPEIDRVREWMKGRVPNGYCTYQGIAYVIEAYLKHKEGEK